MTHGSIIGYDINAKMCQISYYNEKTQEPETVDTGKKDVYGKGQYLRGRDLGVCAWQ